MRTSVFVGTSLDGFIAREDGSLDFLAMSPDEDNGFEAFLRTVDAVVMGRKTFETVLSFHEWPYGKRPVVVLSTTLTEARGPRGSSCDVVNASPAKVLARLAKRGVQHVYVDGGATVQAFLRAGLVQEITITRCPVLVGTGIPLFGALPRDINLRHVATRVLPSGFVQSEYRVVPQTRARSSRRASDSRKMRGTARTRRSPAPG